MNFINNQYFTHHLKRNFNEIASDNSNPVPKLAKISTDSWQVIKQNSYLIPQILKHLSFRELLSFERACSSHLNITESTWNLLSQKKVNRISFDVCKNEKNESKWNCILEKALFTYVKEHRKLSELELILFKELGEREPGDQKNAFLASLFELNVIKQLTWENIKAKNAILRPYKKHQLETKQIRQGIYTHELNEKMGKAQEEAYKKSITVFQRFAGLRRKFKIWDDFLSYNLRLSLEMPLALQKVINKSLENSSSGELLLSAITQYQDHAKNIGMFYNVIEKGGTRASLIALKLSFFSDLEDLHIESYKNLFNSVYINEKYFLGNKCLKAIEKMAILAAKKKDFKALEKHIKYSREFEEDDDHRKTLEIFQRESDLPLGPITAALARIEDDPEKRTVLYKLALEQYTAKYAPKDVIVNAC